MGGIRNKTEYRRTNRTVINLKHLVQFSATINPSEDSGQSLSLCFYPNFRYKLNVDIAINMKEAGSRPNSWPFSVLTAKSLMFQLIDES